jgi:multidrug resistance protein
MKLRYPKTATFLAFALVPLSGFVTDMYIPSLPGMAATLHTGPLQVQLTLTVFLISYGVFQLFVGPVLDSYGRYKLSLVSLLVLALSGIAIAVTHNIYLIYAMRVVHGITVSFIVVGKRAFFIDVYSGDKLKHYLSLFSIIWSTGPIVAPFIGGYLQTAFGWQANFYALAILATLFLVLEFFFSGETLPKRAPFQLRHIAGTYGTLLGTASFTLGMVMLGLAYCMVMVFNLTGSFIIEHHFQQNAVVAGYSSLLLGFAWMTGGFIGKATIHRPFFRKLSFNLGWQLLFAAAMLVSIPFVENIYTVLFFAFLIHVCAGYTFNNFFTFCLSSFPRNAGIASGLTGGVNYVIVSLFSSGILSFLPAKDERNLNYSYWILILLSIGVMSVILRLNRVRSKQDIGGGVPAV